MNTRALYRRLTWLLLSHDLGDGMTRDYELDPRVSRIDVAWPAMRVGICIVHEQQLPPVLDLIHTWNVIQVHDWRVLFVRADRVMSRPRSIIAAISQLLRTRRRTAVVLPISQEVGDNDYTADTGEDIDGESDTEREDRGESQNRG